MIVPNFYLFPTYGKIIIQIFQATNQKTPGEGITDTKLGDFGTDESHIIHIIYCYRYTRVISYQL